MPHDDIELLVLPSETAADRARLRRMVDALDRRERRAARLMLLVALALILAALFALHAVFPQWFPTQAHRISSPADRTTAVPEPCKVQPGQER